MNINNSRNGGRCASGVAGILAIAMILTLIPSTGALADYLIIDGALGMRSIYVDGIELMSQQDVAQEAALFALAPEGWNLAALGGGLVAYGPPDWDGGLEWGLGCIPAESSSDWGYDLNGEAIQNGNCRSLVFHTDDTVSRMEHDICEPSPYGVISGLMSGIWSQCAVVDWGLFYLDYEDPTAVEAISWEQVKVLYR